MSERFTPVLLTARSGRKDGDVSVPAPAMRDEETGKVYAFPGQDEHFGVLAADVWNMARPENLTAIGYPDEFYAEEEPFTAEELSYDEGDLV